MDNNYNSNFEFENDFEIINYSAVNENDFKENYIQKSQSQLENLTNKIVKNASRHSSDELFNISDINRKCSVIQSKDDQFQLPAITLTSFENNKRSCSSENIETSPLKNTLINRSDSVVDVQQTKRLTSSSPLPSPSTTTKNDNIEHVPYNFKCQLCQKLYKDPRILNCLHSFCLNCLINQNSTVESTSLRCWSPSHQPNNPQKNNIESSQSQQGNCSKSQSYASSSLMIPPQDTTTTDSNQHLRRESRSSIGSFKSINRKSIDKSLAVVGSGTRSSIKNLNTENIATYIVCAICQFYTEIPVGGIKQLNKNYILVKRIEDAVANIGNEMISNIWCSLCFEEMPATFHCLSCVINLCSFCKEAHERQKSTTDHCIQSLLDLRKAKNKEKSIPPPSATGTGTAAGTGADIRDINGKFTMICELHPGLELKLFCNNCQQIICSDCVILLHKNHKCEQGVKIIKTYMKLIKEAAEKTQPLCDYTDHSISQLAHSSRKINDKCNQIQTDVENFMAAYFEAIDAHRKTLLQQISRARETKMQMILEQQLEMEKRSSEAKSAVEFSQELIEKGNYAEVLSFVGILLKRFEYCQKYKPPLDSKISDALHFLAEIEAPSTKAQNNIPLFGIITTQTVEPQFCTLETEGYSQLRVHKKVELIILSRDGDGVPLCHGGLTINATVKYKECVSKLIEIHISDRRDGTYAISFVPEQSGNLALAITINKRHIKDSPFGLTARTLRPHSGHYHCCTFCSSKGSKIITCACKGTMNGYKGCGHGHTGHPGRRHWSCCASTLENSECTTANQF